eukprot:s2029_g10.t1
MEASGVAGQVASMEEPSPAAVPWGEQTIKDSATVADSASVFMTQELPDDVMILQTEECSRRSRRTLTQGLHRHHPARFMSRVPLHWRKSDDWVLRIVPCVRRIWYATQPPPERYDRTQLLALRQAPGKAPPAELRSLHLQEVHVEPQTAARPPRKPHGHPVIGHRHVAVTSSNPDKLAAIETAFCSHFGQKGQAPSICILPCPADSGIPHGQPWGMQHTYEGALARLANLKSSGEGVEAEYYASAENGVCALLRHDSTLALDVACVIVERASDGKQGVNFSQGRPYPLQEIQQMKRSGSSNAETRISKMDRVLHGAEIGDFCKWWYEKKALPISRTDQVVPKEATTDGAAKERSQRVFLPSESLPPPPPSRHSTERRKASRAGTKENAVVQAILQGLKEVKAGLNHARVAEDSGQELLLMLRVAGVAVEQETFVAMIRFCVDSNHPAAAAQLIAEMEADGHEPQEQLGEQAKRPT